jgi:hypothetical protein
MRTLVTFVFVGSTVFANVVRIAAVGKPRPPITGKLAAICFVVDLAAIVGLLYIGGVI